MEETADRLGALLNVRMRQRGSVVIKSFEAEDELGNDFVLLPNFGGEETKYLREPDYKNFPLLFTAISEDLDLLFNLEQRFSEAPELRMTLLRRKTSDPDGPNPPEILYALPPTTLEGGDTDAKTSSDSDNNAVR